MGGDAMNPLLLVAAGAAVGAIGRYLAESLLQREGTGFPWGTFMANVVGSFVLGAAVAAEREQLITTEALLLVGTGFSGALTTFSGFAARLDDELRTRRYRLAAAYLGGTLIVGLAAALAGYALLIR
jgi:CrcB protein